MKFKPLLLLLLMVVGLGAGCSPVATTPISDASKPVVAGTPAPLESAPVDEYAGWKTITPGGVVSLRIPAHCDDSGAAGSTYVMCPTPNNDQPIPDMLISTDGSTVMIRRWENLDWEYRDKVIASLRVVTPLTHAVTVVIEK